MRNFPHEKLPKTKLNSRFVPNFLGHNRCSDQKVLREIGGAQWQAVQGNSLFRLWEDHHAGKTK